MLPQYDSYGYSSNFLPEEWQAAQAPQALRVRLRRPTSIRARRRTAGRWTRRPARCSGPNSSLAVGTLVPNTGSTTNGVFAAGQGPVAETNHEYPALGVNAARRRRVGSERRSDASSCAAARGLFYDRPPANTRLRHGQQPAVHPQRHGALRRAAEPERDRPGDRGRAVADGVAARQQAVGLHPVERAACRWRCRSRRRSTWPIPGSTATTRTPASISTAIDLGAAFLPANQNPALATSLTSTDPATSYVSSNPDLVRFYRGFAAINQQQPIGWRTYHSIQFVREPAVQQRAAVRVQRHHRPVGQAERRACGCSTIPTARSRPAPTRRTPTNCSATTTRRRI